MNASAPRPDGYKWIALSNTSLGAFMAVLDSSIVISAMPAIFRGMGLNPLAPGNISYLLWVIMGYILVTAVVVVTVGRLGDMFGRVWPHPGSSPGCPPAAPACSPASSSSRT